MIYGKLSQAWRVEPLHPLFPKLFEYVRTHDLLHEPLGRIEVLSDSLFINNSEPTLVPQDKQVLEVHRKYIDVHILLEGRERVGWLPTGEAHHAVHVYDEAADFATFADQPSTYVDMRPGDFLIVYPEDAHAPIIGDGTVRKLIAKVLL